MRLLFLGLCSLFPAFLSPLSAADMPAVAGTFMPVVGSWAQYDFAAKIGSRPSQKGSYKVAVVGEEGGQYWVEQTIVSGKDTTAVKMLTATDVSQPSKVYIKFGDKLVDASAMFKAAMPAASADAMVDQGISTITVAGAAYPARHRVSGDGTIEEWTQDGIGPFGVLKQTSVKDGATAVLTLKAYGLDAKPEITGQLEASGPGIDDGQDLQKLLDQALHALPGGGSAAAADGANLDQLLKKAEDAQNAPDPIQQADEIAGKKKK